MDVVLISIKEWTSNSKGAMYWIMTDQIIEKIRQLSVEDRILIARTVLESIIEEPVQLTSEQKRELEELYDEYLKDPDAGDPWAVVKERILSR